jgi:hypothetical protein
MYTEAKSEIARVASIFNRKKKLENMIAREILEFEEDTGLRIDSVHYQRDITLPTKGSLYTDLSIVITQDEIPTKVNRKPVSQEDIERDLNGRKSKDSISTA